ncbi:MAG: SDR family oxidoreductase [Candidatus Neomarinimicrobiota bacterium]|nr:SDR family oxidoreductase [Candidatus Neomarinimicrobiota bacterium]MEC9448269.1 SDR family oxidoreductase [Candidatus Neomarinimicrobiota bacterium]
MKTLLITGAYGQLGDACVKFLKNNYNITLSGVSPSDGGVHLDIRSKSSIKKVLSDIDPDVILNLAALTDVDGCELDPQQAKDINFSGVKNLCRDFSGHFIQISTDYVFDGKSGPYSEEDEPNPKSVYGKTKLFADNWLLDNYSKSTIIRTNILYSYTKRTKASFLKWVVDSLNDNQNIKVVNDQWNNPTWTESLSSVISKIIDNQAFDLYHYGDRDILNRFDFSILISKVFNLDSSLIMPISSDELNQIAPRPRKSGLITKKIESELGIIPKSVETCLNEIRKQFIK